MMSDEDCDAVAEFIRSKGITRCPTACVLPTQGLVAAADRIELHRHAVMRDRVRRERAAARWRFMKGSEEQKAETHGWGFVGVAGQEISGKLLTLSPQVEQRPRHSRCDRAG